MNEWLWSSVSDSTLNWRVVITTHVLLKVIKLRRGCRQDEKPPLALPLMILGFLLLFCLRCTGSFFFQLLPVLCNQFLFRILRSLKLPGTRPAVPGLAAAPYAAPWGLYRKNIILIIKHHLENHQSVCVFIYVMAKGVITLVIEIAVGPTEMMESYPLLHRYSRLSDAWGPTDSHQYSVNGHQW